jgi:zinc/manganese transport system substrate-binding protein
VKRWAALWLAVVVTATLSACGGATTAGSGEIVVTTNILGDVVRNVVGDAVTVRVLMPPDADPHSFGVSAQDAAAMSSAALIVYNGLGLEEGVTRNVEGAAEQGVPALAVGDRVEPLTFTQGENAGAPDPHFWTDPQRMITAVDAVEEAVLRSVPAVDADAVVHNADRYRARLRALTTTMSERFATIAPDRRKLVTNHHVLGYFAKRFGFTVIGAVVPSGTALAAPSASDLQSLATTIRSAGVPAIFVDSSKPEKLARALAEESGLAVRIVPLYSESLSPPGTPGATYVDMMRANADAITTGLR